LNSSQKPNVKNANHVGQHGVQVLMADTDMLWAIVATAELVVMAVVEVRV
jgi:hypothetical protein